MLNIIKKIRIKLNKKIIDKNVFLRWREVRKAIDNADNPELLIAGSSHGACGIIGSIIDEKALNICFDSIDLYLTNILVKEYIEKFKSIKKVIITYSLFSNSYEVEKIPSIQYIQNGLEVFLDIKTREKYDKKDKKRLSIIKDYKALYIDNINSENEYREQNGDQKELPAYNAPKAGKTVVNHINHYKRNTSQNIYVEDLISYCKERNIDVFIVITPVREDYKKAALQECGEEGLFKDIREITDLHNNAYLLYYFLSEQFSLDEFRDADHLNRKGAEKLSRLIKIEVDKHKSGK